MRAETKNAGGVEYSLISYEFCQGFKVEQRIILGIPALDIKSTSIDDGELKMFREREKEFQDTVEGRFKNEFEHKSLTEALRGYGRSGIIIIGNLMLNEPSRMLHRVASFVASAEVGKEEGIIPAINQIITIEDLIKRYTGNIGIGQARVERVVDRIYPSKHPRIKKMSRFAIARSFGPIFDSAYQVFIEDLGKEEYKHI